MLVTVIIILSILLVVSLVGNILLYKAGMRHLGDVETLSAWITEFKMDVMKTYHKIKLLDDREIFSKDDEVGIVFQDLLLEIEKLNERTHSEDEE